MAEELSMADMANIKHWQVMDPGPEIIQLLDDRILVAKIIKAQVEYKQEYTESYMKAMTNYYSKVIGMLDAVVEKAPGK
jgi:hypothetical protein